MSKRGLARAVLGGRCFWCLEAFCQSVAAVTKFTSGYAGGALEHATSQQVCANQTGHADVVAVTGKVGYGRLLMLFWQMHDPTTKDRQKADADPQYRSLILSTNEDQERAAMASRRVTQTSVPSQIVTEAMGLKLFGATAVEDRYYHIRSRGAMSCQFFTRAKLYNLGVGDA